MLKALFSTEARPGAFFRRIDWTAFWCATAVSFSVYFATLGPSVGLEDSGELATAADHLGVPHPPGYPFWTFCGWMFCRVFSWVTYMGQPTPAWAVSLFSAVAGAFAAGCTAMLICRSSSDMLDSMDAQERVPPEQRHALMGFAGGLGGALTFAFSPVEWSQATIVEVYTLNALFLMAVFLLAYRWMRKPSDKILWLTAFVFGLGLTNYQVLLLAAVPIGMIILLKDIRLFRDLLLILIPVGLTAQVLQIGAKERASAQMDAAAINKFIPVTEMASCPNEGILWGAAALLIAAPLAGMMCTKFARRREVAVYAAVGTGLAGVVMLALAATVFAQAPVAAAGVNPDFAPLLQPGEYVWTALPLAAACTLALGAAFAPPETHFLDRRVWTWLAAAGACALVAFLAAVRIPAADDAGFQGKAFNWALPSVVFVVGVSLVLILSFLTPHRRGLAFAIPVAAAQIVAFTLLRKGAMNGLTHPTTWWFFWPCIWNIVMLGLAAAALPTGRTIAPALLFAEIGVGFYAYMPIASELRHSVLPMNWGYPRTWKGFKHAIMRGQYDDVGLPPNMLTPDGFELFCSQVGFYLKGLRMQFTLFAASLAFIPFALWKCIVRTKRKVRSLSFARIAVGLYAALTALLFACWPLSNGKPPCGMGAIPVVSLAVLAGIGVYFMIRRQLSATFARMLPRAPRRHVICMAAFALLAFAAAILPLPFLSQMHFVPILVSFGVSAVFAAEFATQLLAWRKCPIPAGVTIDIDDVSQQWLIAVFACFSIMSFFLAALARVTGDIQDGFIQKVKFTSSHAMLSLWIGYGLAIVLVAANRLAARFTGSTRVRRLISCALCVLAGGMGLIPVCKNYADEQLVFTLGAAEQNGHTFGWQFGNYLLRGAHAIREELSPDEEPLPNPLWPEEMEPSSIFFGGSDPGRFVPTYMVHSANVRPDVYIFSQNPLVDDTYTRAQRDLYGDTIWTPSEGDRSDAFYEYVQLVKNEVLEGKRETNDDIRVENGRVHVTGTKSVMEVNGILVKKMFDHERLRHAFYVEEDVVIPWMYDYLTPHGLIMKINANENAMTDAIVRGDMDFWDWYTRRLLHDPAFRRDFAAQKTFSRLRASIAGLYANIGKKAEGSGPLEKYNVLAATAFREAVTLYPGFPETSRRYITEHLALTGKRDAILDIVRHIGRVDPNNESMADFKEKPLAGTESQRNTVISPDRASRGSNPNTNLPNTANR